MISLQAHNQVLFHLTQLASAVNPWSAPLVVKANTKNKSIRKNADEISYNSFREAAQKYTELSEDKLNMRCIRSTLKAKESKALLILNQLLANNLERPVKIDCKWKVSYVSGASFAENKQDFPCSQLIKPVVLPTIYLSTKQQHRLFQNFTGRTSHLYNVQLRHFKTQRTIKMEQEQNPTLMYRVKKLMNMFTTDSENKILRGNEIKETDLEKLKQLFNTNDVSAEEKRRIKTAFVEGYEAGLHRQTRARRGWLKVLQHMLSISIVLSCIWLMAYTTGGGSIFKIPLGSKVEVDPEEIHVTFDDARGVDEAKQELKDVVEFLKNPEKFTTLGGKLPKGVLLVGPPGTGKTLLARAVAGEAGVPFFHAAGPEFDEILVGQGARRVRDLFKAAKDKAPCVVFIDEIDSVGATRTHSVLHPYANQTINQLLSEMDGFHQNEGVIVLGATNRREDLDKALLRPGRFDVEIFVKPPDYYGRKEILDLYLRRILTRNVDVELLARTTTGFTGADLENMVNQAAIRAAMNGADYVDMDHLEYAKDKVIMGPEGKSKVPDEETNLITAIHEGGHTIVAIYTKDADPVHKVTILPRGHSLGHTAYIPEKDTYLATKSKLLAKMDSLMGGRAAEELIFGPERISTGASSDFKHATHIAESMVKLYGMSDKVGFRIHKRSKDQTDTEYGPGTNELIDSEVKRLLQESYDRAKTLLKLHSKELRQLADALLKYETLDAEDVNAIMTGKKTKNDTSTNKIPPIIDVSNKNVM